MADETERFDRALDFMRMLGISHAKVSPVLRRLIQLYDNNWDMIEDENYRALADSYFEELESKEEQLSPRVTRSSARLGPDSKASPSKPCEWRMSATAHPSRGSDIGINRKQALSPSTNSPNKGFEWSGSRSAAISGVEDTTKRRDVTSPSEPSSSCSRCLNFVGDEEKLAQSEGNPLKQVNEEGPSTSSVYDSCNVQQGYFTRGGISIRYKKCSNMRWEEAVSEEPASNENTPTKKSKTERESSLPANNENTPANKSERGSLLPAVEQLSSSHAGPVFSFMKSPIVVKNKPIEIPQPEMALVPSAVSAGALCLWQHNKQVPSQIVPSHAANNDERKQRKVCFTGEKHAKFSGIIARRSVKDEIKHGEGFLSQIANADGQKSDKDTPLQSTSYDKALVLKERDVDMPLICAIKEVVDTKALALTENAHAPFAYDATSEMFIKEKPRRLHADVQDSVDISRGQEVVPITIFNNVIDVKLTTRFHYISKSIAFQNARINFSLAQIEENDCCTECSGDCLQRYSSSCRCAREMGGEFAYNTEGQLRGSLLEEAITDKKGAGFSTARTKYCVQGLCMFDQGKPCKGHLVRKFIKECWSKCGCNMQCGNRVVQKGIRHNLQVFFANKKKGWGVRTLEDLPAGTFVCEYVGEILTNTELYMRNKAREGHSNHYPVLLDADWNSDSILKDNGLLCLDATNYGNIARFINHRCYDANLVDIPVEIESPDHRYYHIALFTTQQVNASEELTWDYIDFEDENYPVKVFQCFCESPYCRDRHPEGHLER